MQLPQIHQLPLEFVNPILQHITIDTVLAYPEHPPILLIDGGREDAQDQAFLEQLYQQMTPPKTYITIARADHYFGVKSEQPPERPITYWGAIMDELVQTIDQWIRSAT
jgi:alpha/beta superfamily hydrolase